jgi:hypothetical protein
MHGKYFCSITIQVKKNPDNLSTLKKYKPSLKPDEWPS